MFEVLCIDDKNHDGSQNPHLRFGKSYLPCGEGLNFSNEDCWALPGLPPTYDFKADRMNKCALYRKSRFVPLSNIDETTLVNVKEEATA